VVQHTVSEKNPLYVTGAESYRISATGFLTPEHPAFAVMEEYFLSEHRNAQGYGLAFLESPEHSVTYVTTPRQIREYRAADTDGTAVLDTTQGAAYAFWPTGTGWDDYVPANTWHPGGEGIIAQFAHPLGGAVVVFEYLQDDADGKQHQVVGFHCERCHPSLRIDLDHNMANRGPEDRRWVARNARQHVRSHTTHCRPVNPDIAVTVTAIANEQHGTNHPVITHENRCAASGACAQIRSLRARGLTAQ